MASAHPIKNTSKPYVCTNCSSDQVSVVREDPQGVNPRLKCNSCQFLFDGRVSLDALEAGAIKPSSAHALADATEPEIERLDPRDHSIQTEIKRMAEAEKHIYDIPNRSTESSIPNRPSYVFLSKPRGITEFCNKKDFRRTAVKWHDRNYDVYELKPLKLTVDVNVVKS